jgi:hypothetical protein
MVVAEFARAGRDDRALLDLLVLLAMHDVLLVENGIPMDPKDEDQVLTKKIQGLLASRENTARMLTVHRARLAKARGGQAVSTPPVGYVPEFTTRDGQPVKTGKWKKDPDPKVREAMEAVFRAFEEGGSLPRTVRLLNEWGIKTPSRR